MDHEKITSVTHKATNKPK